MKDIIEDFQKYAETAFSVDYGATKGAILDAKIALKRIIKRNELGLDQRWEIVVSRGPRLEFTGRLLATDSYLTKGDDPLNIELHVYQTVAGALIGVSSAIPASSEGYETIQATVVEPTQDLQAMRFAIMDGFGWSTVARAMARKKLKWSLRRDID